MLQILGIKIFVLQIIISNIYIFLFYCFAFNEYEIIVIKYKHKCPYEMKQMRSYLKLDLLKFHLLVALL